MGSISRGRGDGTSGHTVSKVSVTPKVMMMKVNDEEGSHSILDSVSSGEGFPFPPSRPLCSFYLNFLAL